MVLQWVGNVLMAIVFGSALYKVKDIMNYIDFQYMSMSLLELQFAGNMNDTVNMNDIMEDISLYLACIVVTYIIIILLAIAIFGLRKKQKLLVLPLVVVANYLLIGFIYLLIDGGNSTGLYIFAVIIGIVLLGIAMQIFSYIDGLKS